MKRSLLALVLAVGLALIGAAPAAAHSELINSTPEAGQALDYAPIGVELVFNQDINESFARSASWDRATSSGRRAKPPSTAPP